MSKYEFMMQVAEQLRNRTDLQGATVTCDICVKNNDTEKYGIIISYGEMRLSSVIYVDEFYYKYQQKKLTVEETANEVVKINNSVSDKRDIDISSIFNWESCKDKIIFRLISAKNNKKYLTNVSYVPFLDLAIMFTLCYDIDEDGIKTLRITKAMMDGWGVEVQDLMNHALINTPRLFPPKVQTLCDVICSFLGYRPDEDIDNEVPMILVTNTAMVYGATTILYEDTVTKLADSIGESFYIIPSSIHEVLVLPQSHVDDQENINSLIREVNSDHVVNEDVLSDRVYFYNKDEKRFYY